MVIETPSELKEFLQIYKENKVIIIPVLSDKEKHILNNRVSFLYIKIMGSDAYYIISFNHSECINMNKDVLNMLNSVSIKYTDNKKLLDSIIRFDNVIDINSLYYLNYNKVESFELKTFDSEYVISRNSPIEVRNINDIIPIMIHIKRLKDYIILLEEMIDETLLGNESLDFMNRTLTSLQKIEENGIYVDSEKLLKYFPFYNQHISENKVYSEYNVFTLTGRPSNKYGRLNFSALNKENGEREFVISRFGEEGRILVFDYDAYHLNLIANIVNFEFPENISIHEYLGKQYFNKDVLTDEEYTESKKVSFNILYGGIDESVKKAIPFFAQTDKFINYVWEKFQKDGFIETLISRKRFYSKNLPDINKDKLFNYILQNYETESNILVIESINKLLEKYKSKLILYYYDGFIFDYDIKDGKEMLIELGDIISNTNRYKYKKYYGVDFHNLVKF